MFWCSGSNQDADASRAGLRQGKCGLPQGAAGTHDIIHKNNVLLGDIFRDCGKSAAYIDASFAFAEFALWPGFSGAGQRLWHKGEGKAPGNRPGQFQNLVKSALLEAFF